MIQSSKKNIYLHKKKFFLNFFHLHLKYYFCIDWMHIPSPIFINLNQLHPWIKDQLNGLMQEKCNSIADVLNYVILALSHRNQNHSPSYNVAPAVTLHQTI